MVGRENPNFFLSSLMDFCVDSVSTCFSYDADKLCVAIGLSAVSALLLLLSCCLLVCQRYRCLRENPGETLTLFYSLLGNMCSTVGAVLSRQLHIQILMGAIAAAMDAVHFISSCFPGLLCRNSKADRRLRMMRKRRRQHLLAVCVLMVVAGGFLNSRVTIGPADRPLSGRRLLHAALQDSTEILGYTLGLLSFAIACTSRFPAVRRAYRGQMLTRACMFSGLLCSLAGVLYAAAILLYDTQFGFLLRVMPWLLSAICCVTLDLLVSLPLTTKNAQKMTEVAGYMDVSVQPARKTCLQEVMFREEVEDQLLNGKVQVIRVDSFCSSDTSYDSSLMSSDLEWDFEEAHAQWSEPTAKQQFPPQEWPTNPKPSNTCTCASSGLSQKTLSGTEMGESVSSASSAK